MTIETPTDQLSTVEPQSQEWQEANKSTELLELEEQTLLINRKLPNHLLLTKTKESPVSIVKTQNQHSAGGDQKTKRR